jgi:hypothetical protein
MAERTRLDTGIGMLGDVPDLVLRGGRVTEETALALSTRLREVVRKVNREISLGTGINGYRSGNLDGQYVDVVTTPGAGVEFPVIHGLKRVPIGYIVVRADVGGADVYDSRPGSWTDEIMYLMCGAGGASLKLLIF